MANPRKIGSSFLRILGWSAGGVVLLALLWLAANRLLDAKPDPRRDEFLRSPNADIPDDKNIAVGVAGLGAPHGADFMEFGAQVKKLYDGYDAWPETKRRAQGLNELELTVDYYYLDCLADPSSYDPKKCPSIEDARRVLRENAEILTRYKKLYRLERNIGFGAMSKLLIPATKLAFVEMRLDMRRGNYEAAYAKWRDQFRFARTYLHGEDGWIGKAIGLVDLGLSFSVLDDLLVNRPSLAATHFEELRELLQPQDIAMFDLASAARDEYRHLERFFRTPYLTSDYEERLDWLAWHLGQVNRSQNRFLAYSIDVATVFHGPWATLQDNLAAAVARHDSPGWGLLVDPFGSLIVVKNIDWQPRLIPLLRQFYVVDGKLRLATLVVRMNHDRVKDADIPAFLSRSTELYDPLSNKPMQWDAKNGRVYFQHDDDKCSITAVRVPVWDARSGRPQPRHADWRVC